MKKAIAVFVSILSTHVCAHAEPALDDMSLAKAIYKSEITSCDELGILPEDLVNVLTVMKAEIRTILKKGQKVTLRHFGTFYMEHIPPTTATNKEGQKAEIPGYDIVRFEAWNPVVEKWKDVLSDEAVVERSTSVSR